MVGFAVIASEASIPIRRTRAGQTRTNFTVSRSSRAETRSAQDSQFPLSNQL